MVEKDHVFVFVCRFSRSFLISSKLKLEDGIFASPDFVNMLHLRYVTPLEIGDESALKGNHHGISLPFASNQGTIGRAYPDPVHVRVLPWYENWGFNLGIPWG